MSHRYPSFYHRYTELRQQLRNLLNTQVTIATTFGSLTGTVVSVENDYVVLNEANDSYLYIPFEQVQLVIQLEER